MKIYIYLTPQPDDICPITGRKICKTIMETIDEVRKNDSEIVPTYAGSVSIYNDLLNTQTESDKGLYNLGYEVTSHVIQSNGEVTTDIHCVAVGIEIAIHKSMEKIELKDLPDTSPISKRLSISAFNYVHGKFLDAHGEEMQEDATLAIKKLREERAQTIRTELDLIARIAKENDLGFIESGTIEDLDGVQNPEQLAKLLSKVVREGEVSMATEISIQELKSYKIIFDSKQCLERTISSGKEDYSVSDV